MAKKILQVLETAHRATIEEQDDTVVWITHAMKGAGGEFGVLLRGNAVGSAVEAQDASGLAFGDRKQTQPPRLAEDVAKLAGKGVLVHVVAEDLAERGILAEDLVAGVRTVPRAALPELFAGYDMVWHW
jgi:intracellular sulfur oxidation DsrE/DsrF family protein